MIILNTEKLVKIKYHKKTENGILWIDKDNNICTFGHLSGATIIVSDGAIEHANSYLENGIIYYLPHIYFFSDNKEYEVVYFKTEELAEQMIEKIKQEPNLKTFTIE